MPELEVAVRSRQAEQEFARLRQRVDEVTTRVDKFGKEIDQTDARLVRTSRTTAAFGQVLRRVGATIGALFAGQRIVRTIAEFEVGMRQLQATTRANAEDMQALETTAREMGATTRFSATEASEGMLFLARAGFSARETIDAIPATLNLAAAGMIGLGEAADIASNVLSQFGLEAAQTERVADVLVNTANRANTDILQLGEAMKLVGPLAGTLGVSLEQTAASLGALGNVGIQASLAGTNLRGVIAALLGPTTEAQNAIQALGLSLQELSPSSNDLVTIFERLRTAGLGAEEALAIFGRRNVSASLALRDSATAIKLLQELLETQKQVAAENAKIVSDSLVGAWKEFISTVDEAILKGGDAGLLGTLKSLVQTLTFVVRAVSGATAATERMELAFTAVRFTVQALFAAFVLAKLRALVIAFGAIATAATTAAAATSLLTGGLTAIAGGVAVAGVVLGISKIREAFRGYKDEVEAVTSALTAAERKQKELAAAAERELQQARDRAADREREQVIANLRAILERQRQLREARDAAFFIGPPESASQRLRGIIQAEQQGFSGALPAAAAGPRLRELEFIAADLEGQREGQRLAQEQQRASEAARAAAERQRLAQEATNASLREQTTLLGGVAAFWRRYESVATSAAGNVTRVLQTTTTALEDLSIQLRRSSITAREAFKELADSVLDELQRIIIRLVVVTILRAIAGLGGGQVGASFQSFLNTGQFTAGGGASGQHGGTFDFSGPAQGFRAPLVLHGDERVRVTPRRDLDSEGGGVTVVQHINISTIDAKSFDEQALASLSRNIDKHGVAVANEFNRSPALRGRFQRR